MDNSDGKVHELIGAQIGSVLVCTEEGCHLGTIQSDGRHLFVEWLSKDGEPAQEIRLAEPAE